MQLNEEQMDILYLASEYTNNDIPITHETHYLNENEAVRIIEDLYNMITENYLNETINELNNKIDAQDKIINQQALEIARLKSKCEILEENNKLLIQQKAQMYEDLDIAYDRIDKEIEEIPQFKGTLEQLDNLTILGDKE